LNRGDCPLLDNTPRSPNNTFLQRESGESPGSPDTLVALRRIAILNYASRRLKIAVENARASDQRAYRNAITHADGFIYIIKLR